MNQTRNAMHEHLNAIAQMVENYPSTFSKQEAFGWQTEKAFTFAKFDLDNEPEVDLKKFQSILIRFLGSARDRHAKIFFHSTEVALLPFAITSCGNKYYISAVDPKEKDVQKKIKIGDAVVSWDGQPISTLITNYLLEKGLEDDLTNRTLAEESLTMRLASIGDEIPHGQVTLGVNQKKVPFDWIVLGETVSHTDFKSKPAAVFTQSHDKSNKRIPYKDASVYPIEPTSYLYQSLGYKDSRLPNLGKIVWKTEPDNPFHAYIFTDDKERKFGFIRLASYTHQNNSLQNWKKFEELIAKMENETIALVIDQQV